jgi:hypothetical protein
MIAAGEHQARGAGNNENVYAKLHLDLNAPRDTIGAAFP